VRFGHAQLLDGIIHDGLWDVYNNQHMGMCAEACSDKYGIDRAALVGRVVGWVGGWTGVWVDGWMGRWLDGWGGWVVVERCGGLGGG
jgi:hypothetical protein